MDKFSRTRSQKVLDWLTANEMNAGTIPHNQQFPHRAYHNRRRDSKNYK